MKMESVFEKGREAQGGVDRIPHTSSGFITSFA